MGHILVLGGARSGKTGFAERLAMRAGERPLYLATAQALDAEMRDRVRLHQQQRHKRFSTIEEPIALAATLRSAANEHDVILVDCLTLWLVGFLTADGVDEARWRQERAALLQLLPQLPGKIVLVSNEIGWGVVPMGAATRWFVDELGWLNQAVAACCERVTLAAAGLPLVLKSS